MFITLFILLFSFQHGANCITAKSARIDSKDIKLVDLIKKDLRRNNDDYIDKFNSKVGEGLLNKQSGVNNVAKTNVTEQYADNASSKKPNHMFRGKDANRRYIKVSDEIDYNKYSFSPVTATDPSIAAPTINPKNYQRAKLRNDPEPASTAPSDDYPKYVKKAKLNQFKQFINKNKDLIQDFINNKKQNKGQPTESMPSLRAQFALEEENEDTDEELRLKGSEEPRGARPAPRQLDMAPAKGGNIHSMRIKGRLCQRNVLVPEGPKYDSKGLVYLAQYAPRARGRDYSQTRPPALVLPRCCNCCRKSVLGCE